jgi:hypothetical protein
MSARTRIAGYVPRRSGWNKLSGESRAQLHALVTATSEATAIVLLRTSPTTLDKALHDLPMLPATVLRLEQRIAKAARRLDEANRR